ncbi:sigma-54-dependent Fis family transcriptional regulator [candidate division KSB1 bacterium]|nr:sigma-54-dependent Fis family transcriptional regulator [candidate division KSB1 bacterium]
MRILIVDDSPNIRLSLKSLLADTGNSVFVCESGEVALDILAEDYFDLLFLDIKLPGMDGLQVLERACRNHPNLKVIMISGHADLEMAVKATRLGAYNFLEKPLNPEKVLLEVKNLQQQKQVETEISNLKKIVDLDYRMIGTSPAMEKLRAQIDQAAPSESRILIWGENGTGKELVAREIHQKSRRTSHPFLKVNCAAIPKELIESELFGHEKGAFTGAIKKKIGVFESANAGTLLMDEIGDMALETQSKLLRVLQENEFIRVGGTAVIHFDIRIISATNKDLQQEIRARRFREDLYFRLNVIPIRVPPLRERKADIPLLIRHFLETYCRRNGKKMIHIDNDALEPFIWYAFPGNIRELKNLIERLVIMTESDRISLDDVLQKLPEISGLTRTQLQQKVSPDTPASLREQIENFEKRLLIREFRLVNGNVTHLSDRLKTDRANLHRKLKKYGLK